MYGSDFLFFLGVEIMLDTLIYMELFSLLFVGMKKRLVLVFVGLVVVFCGGLALRHYFPYLK